MLSLSEQQCKKKYCSSHSPATSSKRESHQATTAETGVFFILALLEISVVIMAKQQEIGNYFTVLPNLFFNFSAIIQSIIGFLAVIFGFALVFYQRHPYYDYYNLGWSAILGIVGIVAGAVICVAGALGIVSCKDPQNHCKNGIHMAFCILACCASVVGIGFFSAGVR